MEENQTLEQDNKEQITQVDSKPLPPVKTVHLHLFRMGRIFSHITFTMCALTFFALICSLLLPFAQLFVIAILLLVMLAMILFTIGTIFVMEGNPMGKMWDFFLKFTNVEDSSTISNFCYSLIPYLSIIGISAGLLSILLLALTRPQRSIGRIVAVSIFTVLIIVPLVVYYSLGGVLWQG